MKPKKAKNQRPNVHCEFPISDEACRALADALTFLMSLEDYSFEADKISPDSADQAEQKLFNREVVLTRGEVRATAKAIDVVLLRLPGHTTEFSYMNEDYPDLLTGLEDKLPILQLLQPVFHQAVKDLRKMK